MNCQYYLQSLPFNPNTETNYHSTRIQHDIHQPLSKHVFGKKLCSL